MKTPTVVMNILIAIFSVGVFFLNVELGAKIIFAFVMICVAIFFNIAGRNIDDISDDLNQ